LIFIKNKFIFIDMNHVNKTGMVRGIKFLIKDNNTIRIWKPVDVEFSDFKENCDLVIKYLIDEGFFSKHKCKVEVVT
jgi:hypothetical protein